jgi:drug/metabolite transporter (DMT)-like permease
MAAGRPSARVWVALATVYLVWGSTYLGIKWSVESLPPFPMLSIRFLVAGALLFAWCSRAGLPRPTGRQWLDAAIVGLCLLGMGNGGVAFAETRIDSGFVALLVAIVPLWVALLGRVFSGTRLAPRALAGIAVGFAGVAVLADPVGASTGDLAAAGVVVLGSLAWAAGSLYAAGRERTADPLLGVSMQMLCGGVLLGVMGAGQWSRVDPGAVTGRSLAALAYLVVVGSIVGYTAYAWLLHHASPSLVSTYAYVNPVVAVLLGALLAGERLTVPTAAGGAVVIVAVMLIVTARPAREPAHGERAPEPLREAA